MPYKLTWKDRLEEAQPYIGPVIAGVVVLALVGWLGWHTLGPEKSPKTLSAPPKGEVERLAAIKRVAGEAEVLEQTYRRALESGRPSEAASAMLNRAIEKQREVVRLEPTVNTAQAAKLAQLEAARDSQRARTALARSTQLEQEARVAQQAGRGAEAREKIEEALRLQREANTHATRDEAKDLVREARLAQEIAGAEAEPLYAAVGTALTLARSAIAQDKWEDARMAYTEARKVQEDLNRRFPSTRYADPAAVEKIDGELASLQAAGLGGVVAARERDGETAAKAGRTQEAAASFAVAATAQRELNEKFPKSRLASGQRAEELEVRRQTVLSAMLLGRAAGIERELGAALRRRQNSAASEKLTEATGILEKVSKEFPRSVSLDPALQRKLAYLALRVGDLDTLQEQVFARLAPLPDTSRLHMLKSEVSQELYVRIMNGNPSRNQGRGLPVDSVSWLEAQEFCERLSWVLGWLVRLPTELEFSRAWRPAPEGAWSAGNSGGRSRETGKSPSSSTGFYDLAGNLAEWLQPPQQVGETAPVAGGSYVDSAEALRILTTKTVARSERGREIGFRIVVELGNP